MIKMKNRLTCFILEMWTPFLPFDNTIFTYKMLQNVSDVCKISKIRSFHVEFYALEHRSAEILQTWHFSEVVISTSPVGRWGARQSASFWG